jgi:hypothetical protein
LGRRRFLRQRWSVGRQRRRLFLVNLALFLVAGLGGFYIGSGMGQRGLVIRDGILRARLLGRGRF